MSLPDDLVSEDRRYFEFNQMHWWITTLRVIGVIIWVAGVVIASCQVMALGGAGSGIVMLASLQTLFAASALGALFYAISYIMTALGWIERDTHLLAKKSKETAGTTDRDQDSDTR